MVDMTIEQVSEEIKGMVGELQKKQDAMGEGFYAKADIDGMLAKMTERVDQMETEMKRPAASAAAATVGGDEADKEKSKAFNAYLRKGMDRLTPDEAKALASDSDPDGGYMVVPTMNNQIIEIVNEYSPIRSYADVQTIGSDTYKQPRQDTQMTANWTGERTTPSESATPKLGVLEIPVRNAYAYPKATQNQLDDSELNIESWLSSEAGNAFALLEGESFINGDTVLEPEGILTNADVLANYVFTGNASAVTADGILKAVYGIKDVYASGANWFMKRASILQVALLKDGEGRSLFQLDPIQGKVANLCGYPIVPTADMPTMTTGTYPIMFANLREGYKIVDRKGITVLRDPYSSKPFTLFYFTKRVGGGVKKAEAIVPVKCATS